MLTATETEKGYEIAGNCSVLTIQFLRLVMHLLLRQSLEAFGTNPSGISIGQSSYQQDVPALLSSSSAKLSVWRAQQELDKRVALDWASLRKSTALPDKDLAMGLHLALKAMRTKVSLPDPSMTVARR